MHTHNFFINDCDHGHVVEAVEKRLPKRKLVPSFNLVEKAIYSRDSLTLVISSEDNHLLGVSDLQCKEKRDDFTTLLATINIITHEQIPGILADNVVVLVNFVFVAHFFEHMKEVVVLAMDVTEYLDWSFERNQCFFFFKHFLYFLD